MATPRTGKPYIWVTWLSKLLGGNQCVWSAWFKAHYKYVKHETEGQDLARWSADHDRLMRLRRQELEEAGYRVTAENQNSFKLEGETAFVAGKPDLVATIATPAPHSILVDGKTGRRRHADWWQVLIYLFAFPKCREDITGALVGELQYKAGDERQVIMPAELTAERRADIVAMIRAIAADAPPERVPSRDECHRCDIGPADCPVRFREQPAKRPAAVGF